MLFRSKNVFIECTALDYTRAINAVIVLVAAFSFYCGNQFSIELVNIKSDEKTIKSPNFEYISFEVETEYIRTISGLKELTDEQIISFLSKMQLDSKILSKGKILATVPPTRTDVLHACDIAEDVAIAYGYDNIDKMFRKKLPCGKPLPITEYCDRLSKEISACLWNQILTFSLCSHKECYELLQIEDDGLSAKLANAKTIDFEIVRTSLIGGLLRVNNKILSQPNLKSPLPLRLYEIADIVLLDSNTDTGARNEKRFSATICDVKSRFEDIHGLLGRFLTLNKVKKEEIKLIPKDNNTCIKNQRADIVYKNQIVGWIGVIHPQVLINFELTKPITAFEIQIEPFFNSNI